ncbi:TetR/AcrR family transcriptional regulator [Bordetella hinzii]|uniref:TetR/AcrR family transcriptional regulator n=2 Tax=Bordetella hinzii TaxID=103855 RepID=A0AAN1S032_9BORD|nr:TetR/AcrR family transcriptional regulator [Bordetella hinzii]QET42365.1 TetR/AcrR family transcriptional regulator [Bordetella hinzii]
MSGFCRCKTCLAARPFLTLGNLPTGRLVLRIDLIAGEIQSRWIPLSSPRLLLQGPSMTSRDPGRYDQIIHAARRLIARHGYRGTSLNMIAAEVGVSKAALYHHFPDKDTLYRSLIAAGMEHLFNEVRAGMQAAGDDPRERLYAFMRASVEYYERHHDSWMSGSQLFWTAESPEHRALVLTWRDAYETLLKDVLRDGVRGGQFRADTDVSLASKFLLSSLNQLSRWYRPGGGKSAREIMDRFVDMFLHGVQTPG